MIIPLRLAAIAHSKAHYEERIEIDSDTYMQISIHRAITAPVVSMYNLEVEITSTISYPISNRYPQIKDTTEHGN